VVRDAEQLVAFLREVFDASGEYGVRTTVVIKIGDSVIMISDAGVRKAMTAFSTSMSTMPT
jgi:uncharacterized glyoxalase superfamily protein PhnB